MLSSMPIALRFHQPSCHPGMVVQFYIIGGVLTGFTTIGGKVINCTVLQCRVFFLQFMFSRLVCVLLIVQFYSAVF